MSHSLEKVEETLGILSNNVNRGGLSEDDKERVVEVIWGLAQDGSLKEYDVPKLVSGDKFHWGPYAVGFLKGAVEVVEVLHPMVARGKIKFR